VSGADGSASGVTQAALRAVEPSANMEQERRGETEDAGWSDDGSARDWTGPTIGDQRCDHLRWPR